MDTVTLWVDDIWRRGIKPEPVLAVSQWADRFRMLAGRASAEPGPWRTARTPYLREVMDALSPSSPMERVVVMAGAQVGKTECGLNWLGFIVHQAPGPVLVVQPTVEMAKRFSKQRLDGVFEETPALRGRVADPRSRDSGNTILAKEFPGGVLILTGANSPIGLRSMPVRYLFFDEVDAFPADAEGEGDPVDLATRRTETFARRKILMVSTPTLRGFSRIEAAFEESDRRLYHIPCPHCGAFAPITWARLRWPEGEPESAHLVCEACGGVAFERDKTRLLQAGEWRPTASGDGRTAGFHLSALYSPWRPWADIAAEHAKVHRDPPRLQVWVNTVLAETWEDQAGEVVECDPLLARREDWGEALPDGVVVLTAGVDVQGDRLELQVTGWGPDEETWVADYRIVWGDPSGPRVWADLDSVLQGTWRHARGFLLPIRATCVDTGGQHTKMAYEFCRTRFDRRIWGIKGRGGPGVPVWPARPSRSKAKTPIFVIGVDGIKDAMASRLKLTEPGPGFIHFARRLDADYFRQLTAERVVTRFVQGRPVRSWQPRRPGERNEALDTFVYAMAALHGLISMGLRLNEERPERQAVTTPRLPASIPSAWMRTGI